MMRETLKRVSVTDAVVNYFRDKIRRGQIEPGQKLPSERELANELGVSRFTLREGLARLSALGLIETYQGKGAFLSKGVNRQTLFDVLYPMLSSKGAKPLRDVIEARILLEPTMCSKAAGMRSEEGLQRLETIVHEMEATIGESDQFGKLDLMFHQEIARIADNVVLEHVQEVLQRAVEEFIYQNVRDLKTREAALVDHQDILDKIRKGDPEAAGESMHRHIDRCVLEHDRKVKHSKNEISF